MNQAGIKQPRQCCSDMRMEYAMSWIEDASHLSSIDLVNVYKMCQNAENVELSVSLKISTH